MGRGAPAWGVFLLFACLYALSMGRGFYGSDGEVMFQTTAALAERGAVALPADPGLPQIVRGDDGRHYSKYDPGLPLLGVPFYVLGDRLAAINHAHRTRLAATALLMLPALAAAGAVTALYGLARALGGPRRGLIGALVAGFATPLWPYGRMLFGEALLACALTGAVLLLSGPGPLSRRRALLAGAVVGGGILTRAAFAIYALPLAWLVVRRGDSVHDARRDLLWIALGALPFAIGVLGHNALRFGALWTSGYAGEGFSTPPWAGVAGLLLSPGKSALLYAPPLLLSALLWPRLRRDRPALAEAIALAWAAALVVYGAWWAWGGGWSWGPRFLVPLLPLSCLPIALLPPDAGWRRALIALAALGVAINALGVLTDPIAAYRAAGGRGASDDAVAWRVAASPIPTAVEALIAGETEPLALFHLGSSGLPPTWTIGLPGVLLAGLALGAWIVVRGLRSPPITPPM